MKKILKLNPVVWGILIFILAQVLILMVTTRIDPFLEEEQIYVPSQPTGEVIWWPGEISTPSGEVIEAPAYSSVGPVVIYFAAVVAAMAIILAVIPLWALRYALRLLFALLFSWGAFILGVFYLPLPVAIIIAVAFGAAWFLVPLVWLHNLVLIMALTALGAVFGRFIAPWTAVVLIVILAVYDFLAVRFGFMIWMADKLANTDALPALVIPRNHKEWGLNLKHDGIRGLNEEKPAGHRYSILGGGDIAFPGLLTASVYFSQGLTPAIIIAFCGLAGLIGAYTMQALFFKGKAVPALPPIALVVVAGLLVITWL